MDGFAVIGADVAGPERVELQVIGEQFAGRCMDQSLAPGQCIRVTTGAVLPAGADTVIIKEVVEVAGDVARIPGPIKTGSNVRLAGEDVQTGDVVLAPGMTMTPAALSLAAALGFSRLPMHRRPTVAVFTTGDEIRQPGSDLRPGEIYDSNRVLLQTLLADDGFEPVAWPALPDDPARIEAELLAAAFSFDVVITCGGVSAGEKDFLPEFMARRGQVHFWKVLMKPGMPLLAGRLGACHVLCLPGNPVSVLATYLTLVRPFLDRLQGREDSRPRQRARLVAAISKSHTRREFLRGTVSCDDHGQGVVRANPADGSHRLRAAADSNALIVVPEGAGCWPEGSVMDVILLGNSGLR
jgi:molybdopterin molybdotransferase